MQYFGIMGEHLTKLGESQQMQSSVSPLPPPTPPPSPMIQTVQEAEEQRRINEILNNPKVC